jgi:hypothetical protein
MGLSSSIIRTKWLVSGYPILSDAELLTVKPLVQDAYAKLSGK